ncbi:MAG: lipid asymmetry maintenance ABC transporter permease subunit MlaE [Gammaproteobacteria bacterium]|jgi:phospholipid/cholesterol/gamma-HCH transport system permease protein|nr:lipid asymmetry maintenance ABC transporter permease subunit MlaE [Gammaproteobacteria bacterium]MBT4494276.1 lipid asymmetry maintenance ABC transporter permease subunit MlaE [Gammaproteobacteria bacterium]
MLARLRSLGRSSLEVFATLGRAGRLWWHAIVHKPTRDSASLVIRQVYQLGVLSVVIIVLSGFSIGAVLALQGYNQLVKYGSESALGLGVALVLVMEIGPVVSALLFAGRAGSAVTAEIGLMKATEQLSSMEMMGVDPLHRVVSPRLWAGFITLPLLAVMFSVVGIWGAAVIGVEWLGVYEGAFWATMQDGVDFVRHVLKGIIKSVVFGLVITWIAVFEGYDSEPTSEGISAATTKTVVFSSVAVLTLDFFLTMIMFNW